MTSGDEDMSRGVHRNVMADARTFTVLHPVPCAVPCTASPRVTAGLLPAIHAGPVP